MHKQQLLKELPIERQQQIVGNMPKVDLHRHLEGALSPELVLELTKKHNIDLPHDLELIKHLVQVTPETRSLVDFLTRFPNIGKLFISCEVIEELAYGCVIEASKEKIKFLELRFSPSYMALAKQLSQQKVIDSVVSGVTRAEQACDTKVALTIIIERQMDMNTAWEVARLAVANRANIVALDLANDEFNFPPLPFAPIFQHAKENGLAITVHAGEAAGPENIKTAIHDLKASRIGHGVRLYQDPELEQFVRDHQIPLELCYTSNLQTQAVSDDISYPLRRYLDKEIKVTLNTDDPGVSGIDLNHEFLFAIQNSDLTWRDLITLTSNAIDVAFCSDSVKAKLRQELQDYCDFVALN